MIPLTGRIGHIFFSYRGLYRADRGNAGWGWSRQDLVLCVPRARCVPYPRSRPATWPLRASPVARRRSPLAVTHSQIRYLLTWKQGLRACLEGLLLRISYPFLVLSPLPSFLLAPDARLPEKRDVTPCTHISPICLHPQCVITQGAPEPSITMRMCSVCQRIESPLVGSKEVGACMRTHEGVARAAAQIGFEVDPRPRPPQPV